MEDLKIFEKYNDYLSTLVNNEEKLKVALRLIQNHSDLDPETISKAVEEQYATD